MTPMSSPICSANEAVSYYERTRANRPSAWNPKNAATFIRYGRPAGATQFMAGHNICQSLSKYSHRHLPISA
jgi:hypothetical protein